MLPFNQGIIIPCDNEQEYKRLDTIKDIYFEKLMQLIKTLLILVKNSRKAEVSLFP